MRSAGYHQVNILASQVLTEVKNVQNIVLQALQAHAYEENEENEPLSGHDTNIITTGDAVQLDMLQALKEMCSEINTLKVARHTNGTGSTDKKKKKVKWVGKTDSYCWSHGACNHESDKCFIHMMATKKSQPTKTTWEGSTEGGE